MDRISKEHRSWNMSRIQSRDTKPEKTVRSILHGLGYRFRLHQKNLPGKPDIVLARYNSVIFVHGCFWHRHKDCKNASNPKTKKKNSGKRNSKLILNVTLKSKMNLSQMAGESLLSGNVN